MSCKQYEGLITESAAGALDKCGAEREAELRGHLAECPQCREGFERQRRLAAAIDRTLERSMAVEPSPNLVSQVRQRIAANANRSKASFWLAIPTARWVAVAFACAAVVAGMTIWRSRQSPGHSPTLSMPRAENPRLENAAKGPRSIKKRLTVATRRLKETVAVGTPPIPARHARVQRTAKASMPQVIVPKNQMALVLELYYGTSSGRIDGASLVAVPPGFKREPDGSLGIAPIEIKPIEIAKLDVGPASPPRNAGSADQTSDGLPLSRE